MFNNWIFWVVIYLITAVIFAQSFKVANKNMKSATSLTILLEILTCTFSIIFIPFFKIKIASDARTYIILFIVGLIYAVTDRLNTESRYGLAPSTFSMLKQLSSVFMLILSFIFLKEELVINKILGAGLIIIANFLLGLNKNGKFEYNKYFIYLIISNFLFAVAMLINTSLSSKFNIAIYTMITTGIPAIILTLTTKTTFKMLKDEFNLYDKKKFLLADFCWSVMLISSVKAYEFGAVSIVAPLLTLTSVLNTIYEFILNKDRKELILKLIVCLIIIFGVVLLKY